MGSPTRLTPNLPSTTLAADFSGDYCENNDALGDIDCVDSLGTGAYLRGGSGHMTLTIFFAASRSRREHLHSGR